MKINNAVFKYIEFELYSYQQNKKEIEQYKDDTYNISCGVSDGQPKGNNISNPTEKKALKLVSNIALLRTENTLNAIDRALKKLPEQHNQLFEYKYQKMLPWQSVVIEMPTSERSYFRTRKELVEMVALELGLVS